jgi:hypothetical protein
MLAHDFANRSRRFFGVIERDRGYEMVQDVRADDRVEEVRVDEAKVAVDGGGGAEEECVYVGRVMREGGVGMLEEGDRDWKRGVVSMVEGKSVGNKGRSI